MQCIQLFQFKTAFGGGRSSGFGLIYESLEPRRVFFPFFPTEACFGLYFFGIHAGDRDVAIDGPRLEPGSDVSRGGLARDFLLILE